MKELFTEQQLDQIILGLSAAVTLFSIAAALFLGPKTPKAKKTLLWSNALIGALIGPVIWVFWGVYNSIENAYGLDSLKALKINGLIAVGLGVFFFLLFSFVPGWIEKKMVPNRK